MERVEKSEKTAVRRELERKISKKSEKSGNENHAQFQTVDLQVKNPANFRQGKDFQGGYHYRQRDCATNFPPAYRSPSLVCKRNPRSCKRRAFFADTAKNLISPGSNSTLF
jgi:hypothetical protein